MMFNDPSSKPTQFSILAAGIMILVLIYAAVVGLLAERLASCGAACQTMIWLAR